MGFEAVMAPCNGCHHNLKKAEYDLAHDPAARPGTGQLVAFTPKKSGRPVQGGKSCATIESGKRVGPAKIAFDAEVMETDEAVVGDSDPYGAGWLVKVKPADWASAKATLIPGTAVAAPYEHKMAADEFAGCAA